MQRRARDLNGKVKEECGLFGIWGSLQAASLTYLGIYSLQHRGQESAGIVSFDGEEFREHRGMGLVSEIFSSEVLRGLNGRAAIGHNRYSTSGESTLRNAQPLLVNLRGRKFAIAHNGNLVNSEELTEELEASGSIFRSTLDSEVIVHLAARSRGENSLQMIIEGLKRVKGAYSLLILTEDGLIAVRDPWGVRPLSMAKLKGATAFASESCAFDLIGANYQRELEPGELVWVGKGGVESLHFNSSTPSAACIFEFIYFARPDSRVFGVTADRVRREMGRQLARESPARSDIVISVPDSSNTAALGYAQQSGIRLEIGLIRNHYVGRTFIKPDQASRDLDARIKYNPVREVLEGKRVVVVDDSIVRGTTSRKLVAMIRRAGAREVHLRVSSPPIRFPCFYGIDTPTKEELIASRWDVEKTREYLGADSLGYLSMEGMLSCPSLPTIGFCTACFNGVYPI